jgi:hypothetical protein
MLSDLSTLTTMSSDLSTLITMLFDLSYINTDVHPSFIFNLSFAKSVMIACFNKNSRQLVLSSLITQAKYIIAANYNNVAVGQSVFVFLCER